MQVQLQIFDSDATEKIEGNKKNKMRIYKFTGKKKCFFFIFFKIDKIQLSASVVIDYQ